MSDTKSTRAAVWAQLQEAGLVQGDCPAAPERPSPWYVRTMLGVAGWIGALFLLGFVGAGLEFVFKSAVAGLLVGGLCCAGAYFIFTKLAGNDLATQAGLATSLAGQTMFIVGLHEMFGFDGNSAGFLLAVTIVEGTLAVLLPNFVHRVWSALSAGIAFIYALNLLGLFGVGAGVVAAALVAVWIEEHRRAEDGSLWRAIGYGLTFAFLLPNTAFLWEVIGSSQQPAFEIPGIQFVKPALMAAVLVFVVYRLLARYRTEPSSQSGAVALLGAVAISLAAVKAPGVTSALIVMILGFACGNRVLLGLGIAGLLGYLSFFYYSMQATLLTKSLVLMGTGAIMLVLWMIVRVLFADRPDREVARA